jgi:peptidyl-prolyl cis-trans isomerase B (cyclophilin B)
MDQKAFGMLFIAITVIAVVALLFTQLSKPSSTEPSPSPDGLFQSSNPNQPTNQNQQNPNTQTNRQIKQYPQFPGEASSDQLKNKKAVIQTSKGTIEFELYPEATKAASNFVFLANDSFYNGLTFHRVEPGFVIQGGDPMGNGSGGPGYKFADEPVIGTYLKGVVAMANSGPNTNGSQFFIMLEDNPSLPKKYTVFGKVIKGQDVVSQIRVGDVMEKVTIEPLK